ncbi:putative DNA recombinase [Opisthocomus hoazin]|uniref:putative DNA recombinase n=1 Tax=Opisthocomus hoazin TaxID=30419 RepID=UPI003F529334
MAEREKPSISHGWHGRAVIYARYSCEKQREESIIAQVRECHDFAKREHLDVVAEYKDEAVSARTDKRPSFQRMMLDARTQSFDYIIVWKGDRFSRDRGDSAKYKKYLASLKIRVLSVTEANIDGPASILIEGINETYAEFYSAELAEKVERGMGQNVREGKTNGGTRTYGYKTVDGRMVVDPEEAKAVKRAFELYTSLDISTGTLGKLLAAEGYYDQYGKVFSSPVLHHMLRNRRYIGEYSFKGTVNMNALEPIIDEDLLNLAIAKGRKNQRRSGKFNSDNVYLLSGLVFCGCCGSRLNGYTGTRRDGKICRKYACVSQSKKHNCHCPKFDKDTLEDAVYAALLSYLRNKSQIDYVAQVVEKKAKRDNPRLEQIEKEIAGKQKQINNLVDALSRGVLVENH